MVSMQTAKYDTPQRERQRRFYLSMAADIPRRAKSASDISSEVPLFPALSLKGTQRYIFLCKVLPAPVLFKAPFSDDKAAAVHSLISMLMLCSFIPRDL